ncbi:uncharacterized protein LOC121394716 [Xenopus laevis]|uniref:Uncharacterized protein LOC121394716 n=1 Tax=Xenopus laevis TaxID=8355 RepID=A0A8J1KYD8_XENLA|nr:uncharacterized protein LOC121394716 [Xenopus laevis]
MNDCLELPIHLLFVFRSVNKESRRKKKIKKPVVKVENLPVTVQSEAATESPNSEKKEKKEAPSSIPEPKSGAFSPVNAFSLLESLVLLPKKPSENKKRKKVLRSMTIEEIIDNKEKGEGLQEQLKDIKSKSSTAQNLNISVLYKNIEDDDIEEDRAPSLKFELETSSFLPQTLEPSKPDIVIEIPEDSEIVIETPKNSETVIEIPEDSETEKQIEEKPIQPTGNICGNEEDELLLQMELLLLLLTCLHQSAEPDTEKQLVHVEPREDTCGDEELLCETEFCFILILTSIYKPAEPEQ